MLRVDQIAGIFSRVGTDASGNNRSYGSEIIPCIQGREAIVLLGVRRKILIAQAEQQGQVRLGSPAVLDKGIPGILPQIGLLVRGLERSLLRQTEQQVGKRRAGRRSAAAVVPLVPGFSVKTPVKV